ncbi:hypothetical protein DM02DRAFT_655795 [Periconia macrospinosa]|uniref:Uncharacterized protein n=1 Tax=Periconia macrospinosa TaxID=97972 RepID=A0A2V1DPF1_9PLEO|nr:hypothetical protein DM02DRAFT_655795 [Periconia macrospinosa]
MSTTSNTAQPPVFPAAEAALANGIASRYQPVNNYNWTYNDPIPLNFTAVEIITFMPWLFTNTWIAQRFVNNGLTNGQHLEIYNTHRHPDTIHEMNMSIVSNSYLNTMRGPGWRYQPKEVQETMWSRKRQIQLTPVGWNHDDITVNGFVPDGRPVYVPSVPILALLRGVKKIPQGPDAADLTRAIEFAAENKTKTSQADSIEYMFPDHLALIFHRMGGRTSVGADHTDGAVAGRYELHIKHRKRLEGRAASSLSPQPIPPERSNAATKPPSVEQTANNVGNQPSRGQQIVKDAPQFRTAYQAFWSTVLHPETVFLPNPPLNERLRPYGQGALANEPTRGYPAKTLLRDLAGVIRDDDYSLFAQAVRISLEPDQLGIDWVVEDLGIIEGLVELGNHQRRSA